MCTSNLPIFRGFTVLYEEICGEHVDIQGASVVNDAGTPGFADSHRISPVFSLQFGSLLQKIKAEAANAGS